MAAVLLSLRKLSAEHHREAGSGSRNGMVVTADIEKQNRIAYNEKLGQRIFHTENQMYRTPNIEKTDYRTSLARKIVNVVRPSAKQRYKVVEVVKRMFGPAPKPGCLSVAGGTERFRWRRQVTFNQTNFMASEVHSYIENQVEHSHNVEEEEPWEGDETWEGNDDEYVGEDSESMKTVREKKNSLRENMMSLMSHLGSQENLADITYESYDQVDTNLEFKLNKYAGKSCLL